MQKKLMYVKSNVCGNKRNIKVKNLVKMAMIIVSGVVISLYLYFMFIEPFLNNDTKGLMKVLKEWQTLNAAFVALLASFIALYTTQYNVRKQKERDFIASKAFLLEALSELSGYLELSAKLLIESYKRQKDPNDSCKSALGIKLPDLPDKYKVTFRDCIHSGEYEVGEYLSEVLRGLQLHNSRMIKTDEEFAPSRTYTKCTLNTSIEILELAEIHVKIGRLYPFARNKDSLDMSPIKREELINSFSNLSINDVDDLQKVLLEKFK